MRPRPQWGLGWRKGGDHIHETGFLQSIKRYTRPHCASPVRGGGGSAKW